VGKKWLCRKCDAIWHLSRHTHCSNGHLLVDGSFRRTVIGKRWCLKCEADRREHLRTHCRRGHEFTPENTKWQKSTYSGVLSRTCRTCMKRHFRTHQYSNRYGITVDEYEAMALAQHGRCAICTTASPGGHGKWFCIDHDHATGKIRGLLCQPCNVKLAALEDAEFMAAATKYLSAQVVQRAS
jgi:hypothetical protein